MTTVKEREKWLKDAQDLVDWENPQRHVEHEARRIIALIRDLEKAESCIRETLALVEEAEERERTSLSRAFDGSTFGAWINARDVRHVFSKRGQEE